MTKISSFFCFVFASPPRKTVDSKKKYFYAKTTAIQFPLISRNHEEKNVFLKKRWKNLEGVVNTPPPLAYKVRLYNINILYSVFSY